MDVLLCENVETLGEAGTVVKVSTGYARNFLFPRKLATVVTEDALKAIKREQHRRELAAAETKADARAIAKKLNGYSLTIEQRATKEGGLYGSVGAAEVVAALRKEGFRVRQDQVLFDAVKELGVYEVPLNLHPDVQAAVRLWVVEEKNR